MPRESGAELFVAVSCSFSSKWLLLVLCEEGRAPCNEAHVSARVDHRKTR